MKAHLWVCVGLTVGLCGCGGSAGGKAPVDSGAAAPVAREITIVGLGLDPSPRNALVTAYALNESGERDGVPLASARTDETGAFKLNLIHSGAPIELEITAIEGVSYVRCAISRCGESRYGEAYGLPANFSLTALVNNPADGDLNSEVIVAVTPWTSMAAKRTRALKRANPELPIKRAAERASAEVSQLIGFEIDKPIGRTSFRIEGRTDGRSPGLSQYIVMNAAATQLIFREATFTDFAQSTDHFTNALAGDGRMGSDDDGFTLMELSEAIVRAVDTMSGLDASVVEALSNLTVQFDLADRNGIKPGYDQTLVLNDTASASDKISAFQHFTAQVRTWVSSIEALNTDELMSAISVDSETVLTILDGNARSQFQFLGEVLEQALSFIAEHPERVQQRLLDQGQETIKIHNDLGLPVGTVRLSFADIGGFEIGIVGEVTGANNTTFRPFELWLESDIAVANLFEYESQEQTSFSSRLARMIAASRVQISGFIGDGQGTPSLIIDHLTLAYALNPSVETEGLEGVDVPQLLKSAALRGEVVIRNHEALFKGYVEVALARLGAAAWQLAGVHPGPMVSEKFRLRGEFISADGAHSFSTSVMGRINSATVFDSFSWAEYNSEYRYISGRLEQSAAIFALVGAEFGNVELPGVIVAAQFDSLGRGQGTAKFAGFFSKDQMEFQAYLECLDETANPGASWAEVEAACAANNLDVVRHEINLSDALLDQLHSTAMARAAVEFADASGYAGQLVIETIYAYGSGAGGEGLYLARVRVPDLERVDRFRDISFTAASRVDFPELRSAQVSATATRGRNGEGDLRIDVKWDGGSYTALVHMDNTTAPNNASLQLFNMQGYQLAIQLNRDAETGDMILHGDALIGATQVGRVELRGGALPLIIYPHGEEEIIESLY